MLCILTSYAPESCFTVLASNYIHCCNLTLDVHIPKSEKVMVLYNGHNICYFFLNKNFHESIGDDASIKAN